jgi:NAD(P)-dependent dehydrogenase (short-subunit alcohol dehydrogenase family)
MSFEGTGVVVTGAAQGIGKRVAQRLAALGSAVVVADLAEEAGQSTVAGIEADGGRAVFVRTDVTDVDSVDELFSRAIEFCGGTLDYAVNNAGIAHAPIDLHELPVATWDAVMDVTLRGTFLCMRKELAHFVETGHGVIVNMASNAGVKNAPGMAGYASSKHGVIGLTKNAALQYARRNIRINAVCPGTIATEAIAGFPEDLQKGWADMMPMGRMGTVDEVADATEFLLSDKSSFITATSLLVDAGYMWA